ncbi:CGNR zinc finger domain-containing protein [Streptomyces sp. NPDC091972]|uniref:CGNR zinc finger domain-containing protein n=1 Tax=Streptomyces sp. NPDC091972 TaxID=3366007 RepID=UPI0038203142
MPRNEAAAGSDSALHVGDGGAGRFRVAPAPDKLRLVQDLLNTAPVTKRRGDVPDLLDAPDSAAKWLSGHGISATSPGVNSLRELRDAIRRSLIARDHGPDAVSGQAPVVIEASARLRLDADGIVRFAPGPAGIPALIEHVLTAIHDAQRAGTWRRLKLCRSQECLVAFWDSSRNTSGVWHDVRTCGNAENLRKSRARRAADSTA